MFDNQDTVNFLINPDLCVNRSAFVFMFTKTLKECERFANKPEIGKMDDVNHLFLCSPYT